MHPRAVTKQRPAVPGVIDTIAAGLSVALAQPLLMAVPLLLDLYYWLGWQLYPTGMTEPLKRWVLESGSPDSASVAETLDQLGRSDLTKLVSLVVPSLLASTRRSDIFAPTQRPTIALEHWSVAVLALIATIVVMGGLYMLYLVTLSNAALNRNRSMRATARAAVVAWQRFLGLMVLLFALYLLVLGPPAFLWAVLSALGVGIGALLLPMIIVAGITLTVLFIFSPEAIAVAEVGPIRAMYLSFHVVRRYFWQTLGLLVASLVITTGLGQLWERLASTPPGLLAAVIANAFFAGGLTMAGIIFFNDRVRWLQPGASSSSEPPSGHMARHG